MQETFDISAFLKAALAEDIGTGDVTGNAVIPADMQARFVMRAREEMVVAGLVFLPELFVMVEDWVKPLSERSPHPEFAQKQIQTSPGGRGAQAALSVAIPNDEFLATKVGLGSPLPPGEVENPFQDFRVRASSGEGVVVILHITDGMKVTAGTVLATLSGPARALLAGERVALNLVQHLSGIATQTRRYVDAVAGTNAKIYDTRKTLPGWRALQKYAVRCGGGHNHRMGLYDAVLIKDNHIAVAGGVKAAVAAARKYLAGAVTFTPPVTPADAGAQLRESQRKMDPVIRRGDTEERGNTEEGRCLIQVECDTLAQLDEAIAAGADMVLLDNMDVPTLAEGVARARAAGIISEASGNVNLDTVRAIAQTGVDRISIGRLTHSVMAVDIGMDEG